MAGLLNGISGFMGSPGGSLVMSGLGAGVNTYKGNQAAKKSQDPMSLYQGSQGQVGYLSDPRHLQGAAQAMTAPGQSQLGASIIGNSMVNSGATLTSGQAKALNPYEKQSLQGSIAPGFMGLGASRRGTLRKPALSS